MAEYKRCSQCNHAEIRAVGVDCPICFKEQRAKMQLAESTYLQQKVSESIKGRRRLSHIYRTYTGNVALANGYRENDLGYYTQSDLPPVRKTGVTDRISTHQIFADQRLKPLPAAGAIPLHPLECTSASPRQDHIEDEDVFFDETPFRETKYVFLNGEVYRGEKPLPEDRALYGIDSPAAAVHAAVKDAMRRSASTNVPSSDSGRTSNYHRRQERSSFSKSRHGKSVEKDVVEEANMENCREFVSPSGRCYRVVEVKDKASRPVMSNMNARSFLREAWDEEVRTKEKGQWCQGMHRCASANVRNEQNDQEEEEEVDGDVPDKPQSKREAIPQKPTKPRDTRKQLVHHDQKYSCLHQSSSPGEKESSSCAVRLSYGESSKRCLPPITQERRDKERSLLLQQDCGRSNDRANKKKNDAGSRSVKCKRGHVDSVSSENCDALSPYSKSPRDGEFSPSGYTRSSRRESDCVVTEGCSRPAYKPCKKYADRKQRTRVRSASLSETSNERKETTENSEHQHRVHQCCCNRIDDSNSEGSEVSEASSWSVESSGSSSSSSTFTSSDWSTTLSAPENEKKRKRLSQGCDRHYHQCRNDRRSPVSRNSSSSLFSHYDEDSADKQRSANRDDKPDDGGKRKHKKTPHQILHSALPVSCSQSTTSVPMLCPENGAEQPCQNQPPSPHRPPVVRAVVPSLPTGMLPPLKEEMLPSTRYEPVCPSPVARPPPPLSEVAEMNAHNLGSGGGTANCVSPALGQLRQGENSASTPNPMRCAYKEIPTEPLQLTRFNDLRQLSFASSGPVCSPLQGALSLLPRDTNPAPDVRSGAPLDLDFITEHVLGVIRDRLAGADGSACGNVSNHLMLHHVEAARAKSDAEKEAETQRLALEKTVEMRRRRKDLLRLRQLLREAQEEVRRLQDAKVPLDNLTSSLKFAFAQVTHFGDDEWLRLEPDEATASHTLPANVVTGSGTFIYADGERKLPGVAAEDSTTRLPNLEVDTATLERLLADLQERRGQHEAHLREVKAEEEEAERLRKLTEEETAEKTAQEEKKRQRQAAAEKVAKEEAERHLKAEEEAAAAAAAARALKEQLECRERMTALLAQESGDRTAIWAEEKLAHDQLVVSATKLEDESRHRAIIAQEKQFELDKTNLCEEEFDVRTVIGVMEAEEAEDLWAVASRLRQTVADDAEAAEDEAKRERQERQMAVDAEDAARRKNAAWQAAQAEEAARLQAVLQRMGSSVDQSRVSNQDSGGDRSSKQQRGFSGSSSKGKLVQSNLIPGQVLNVSEEAGKIRLVGDPHVAAVEARLRERRRADRLRQERLASAMGRPPTAKIGHPGDRRPANREPSTVSTNGVGSGVTSSAKKTGQPGRRASSRLSLPTLRSRNSTSGGGGTDRLGPGNHSSDAPPSHSHLYSESSFVEEGDLDLGVEGRQVGTPYKTRSRASSLASAGVPHMGGIFTAATPHKNRFPDDETDALTSSSAFVGED